VSAAGTAKASESEARGDPDGAPEDPRDGEDEASASACWVEQSDQRQKREKSDE